MNIFNSVPSAYRCYLQEVIGLDVSIPNDGANLPDSLLIAPGRYRVAGETYDMTTEGLYRFVDVLARANTQRIACQSDPIAIISAVQWITTQSYVDEGLAMAAMTTKALTGKILCACNHGSRWAKYLLESRGFAARIVNAITKETWNNYCDGHGMLEVWLNGKWLVFDVVLNTRFWQGATPLSLIELVNAIEADEDYQIEYMALDAGHDPSGTIFQGFSGSMFFEMMSTEHHLRDWYARILQIPIINDSNHLYYYDTTFQSQFQQWGYVQISEQQWMADFYDGTPPKISVDFDESAM